MNEVSASGLEKYAREVHLSAAQVAILVEFRDTPGSTRPSFKEYSAFQRRMAKVDPSKLKLKTIPHTRPGHERNELKLDDDFDARRDLPEGWGVYSRYDSGSNFGVRSAGQIVLTNLWNSWYSIYSNTRQLIATYTKAPV